MKKQKIKKEVKKSLLNKNKILLISFLIAIFLIFLILLSSIKKSEKINSFEDCVNAGNLVEDSTPKKCITKEGRAFFEELGEEISFERVLFVLKNPLVKEKSSDILNDIYSFREAFGNETFNFENNSLVVVFGGEKPTGGYSIEIKKIIKKKDRFVVYAEEKIPEKGCLLTQVISYPFDLAKIEKTSISKTDLIIEEKVYSCSDKKISLK